MTTPYVSVRRTLRLAVVSALQSVISTGIPLSTPGDWNVPEADLPKIHVRSGNERKDSVQKGMPQFTTSATIEVHANVSATTDAVAQDQLEALCGVIEQAIFCNIALGALIQQISSVDTTVEFSSEGRVHLGGANMRFTFETFESFDPTDVIALPAILSMGLHADLLGTYDPTGTYQNPPFPASVIAAPRSSGPDGRDEGALDITLPQ